MPQLRGKDLNGFWIQQDGATSHFTLNTIELLSVYFDGRVISRNAAVEWPPHSSDLNPLDYYLWGILDKRVQERQLSSGLLFKRNSLDLTRVSCHP